MKIIISYIANIFIVGLFLYSKLLPHKDKLGINYKNVFNFFERIFSPILNLFKRIFKPLQVGTGLYIDMTQIVFLILLLIIGNL